MVKKISFVFFFCINLLFSHAQILNDYTRIREQFFPAGEGSVNEAALIVFIEEHLKKLNVEFRKSPVDNDEVTTNSFNLEVNIPGKNPDLCNLLVIIPLDSYLHNGKYIDVSISHLTALNLISHFSENRLERNVIFLFAGAGARSDEDFWGVKQYMNNNSGKFDTSLVTIINLIGDRGEVYASGSLRHKAVPAEILRLILLTMKNTSFFKFDHSGILSSRLGFEKKVRFYDNLPEDTKSVVIFGNHVRFFPRKGGFYGETAETEIRSFFVEWLNGLDRIHVDHDFDYNYQFFGIGKVNVLIGEFTQILVYISLLIILLVTRPLIFYFRSPIRYLTLKAMPYYAVLFGVYYSFAILIYLSGYLVSASRNASGGYTAAAFLYFGAVFFIPLFIIITFLERFQFLPLPRHNVIYIHGATLFSYINFMIVIALNLSLAFVYLIVIIMLVLSHLTGRNLFVKYILYLTAFIPFISIVFTLSTGYEELVSAFFRNPLLQHFLFCYFSFPFILILIRVSIINRVRLNFHVHKMASVMWILIMYIAFLLIFTIPERRIEETEKNVMCDIYSDYSNNKSFVSIYTGDKEYSPAYMVNGVSSAVLDSKNMIETGLVPKKYTVTQRIDADEVVVVVDSLEVVNEVQMNLLCPENISFSNINFKYMIDRDRSYEGVDVYAVRIPRNPAVPLEFKTTLPEGYVYTLEIKVIYEGNITDTEVEFFDADYIRYRSLFYEELDIDLTQR